MKKILFLLFGLMLLTLSSCKLNKEPTIKFINSSDISLRYKLLDDNERITVEYEDLIKKDLDNGYIYHTTDNSESYYFLTNDDYENPVMSYYSFNNIDNDSGRLFGLRGGSATTINENKTLGVNYQSLSKYLLDQGFKRNMDKEYIKNSYYTINSKYISWNYFIKEDIFINFAVELTETSNLAAFEIGINNDVVNNELIKNNKGYEINFVSSSLSNSYYQKLQANHLIHLKLYEKYDMIPKLYVNGKFVSEFKVTEEKRYFYEAYYFMPNNLVSIEIKE